MMTMALWINGLVECLNVSGI